MMQHRFHPRTLGFIETEAQPRKRWSLKIDGYTYWFTTSEDHVGYWELVMGGKFVYSFTFGCTLHDFFERWQYFKNTRFERGTPESLKPVARHIETFHRQAKIIELTGE